MQQLTEHFKFSSRHGGIRPSFSLRPILRWPRPLGLDQRRMGAIDENIVLIRFYRKKFTLANASLVDTWFIKAKNSIEHTFNNTLYKCYHPAGCCKCTNGINVRVELNRTYISQSADYLIMLTYTTGFLRSGVYMNEGKAELDSLDVNVRDLSRAIDGRWYHLEQIPVVHEFGHMLGLLHPGGNSNEPEAYLADANSLMGYDMFVTEDSYNTAFCSKIRTSSKNCNNWKAGLNMEDALA